MVIAVAEIMSESTAKGFGEFYEAWFDRVYNYARHRTGSASRSDEIVSDTFARVFKAWDSYDSFKGDRRSWLFSIAFRSVADHYRSEKRRKWLSLGLLSGRREEIDSSGRTLEEKDKLEKLMYALDALSEQQREIVSLKFFANMNNRAIAKLMNLSEQNVAVILFRCVRRMRQNFPEGEPDHG